MAKNDLTTASVNLGLAILLSSASAVASEFNPVKLAENTNATDELTLNLSPDQRTQLFNLLKKMNAEIKDWQTIETNMAPSKCAYGGD